MKIDVNHYQRIDNLIRLKITGSPEHLAGQVGISKRQTLKILKDMKELFNAPIKYNTFRKTYFYSEEGLFVLGFQKCKKEEITHAVIQALKHALFWLMIFHIQFLVNNF